MTSRTSIWENNVIERIPSDGIGMITFDPVYHAYIQLNKAVGYWPVAVGYWLLAGGYWPLAVNL